MSKLSELQLREIANNIKAWAKSLGFVHVGISDIDLNQHKETLITWLEKGYQGEMDYLARNIDKRLKPEVLHPSTVRVISVAMNYLPPDASFAKNLGDSTKGYISRYALGRDYHKVLRKRLVKLAKLIQGQLPELDYRPFVDSAPVLEHALAEKAGVGWTGKHSLTMSKESGSWFFLGELFINISLPVDTPVEEGCGSCNACMTICPTQAIVEPYIVDARKCISYLTIEHDGTIPIDYRAAIGNRIYGCDDCQLICPWNKYAQITQERDFFARQELHGQDLLTFFNWTEEEFLKHTEGSAIRRIGYKKWIRNIAIALGNARESKAEIKQALLSKLDGLNESETLLKEHISWAIEQLTEQQFDNSERQRKRLTRSIQKGMPKHA